MFYQIFHIIALETLKIKQLEDINKEFPGTQWKGVELSLGCDGWGSGQGRPWVSGHSHTHSGTEGESISEGERVKVALRRRARRESGRRV